MEHTEKCKQSGGRAVWDSESGGGVVGGAGGHCDSCLTWCLKMTRGNSIAGCSSSKRESRAACVSDGISPSSSLAAASCVPGDGGGCELQGGSVAVGIIPTMQWTITPEFYSRSQGTHESIRVYIGFSLCMVRNSNVTLADLWDGILPLRSEHVRHRHKQATPALRQHTPSLGR